MPSIWLGERWNPKDRAKGTPLYGEPVTYAGERHLTMFGPNGSGKGATIEIKKRIPLLSGLGGDSSDAAAVLRGLNQLWELGLSQNKLREIGSQLGSDVPFFFLGGTALMEGRGEKITPLNPMPHQWVILIIPRYAISAAIIRR